MLVHSDGEGVQYKALSNMTKHREIQESNFHWVLLHVPWSQYRNPLLVVVNSFLVDRSIKIIMLQLADHFLKFWLRRCSHNHVDIV